MNKWQLEQSDIIRRRMGKTGEELNELGAVVSRIQIQGIDAVDPGTAKINRDRLEEEIADVYAQLDVDIDALGLDAQAIAKRRARKRAQMYEWEALYLDQADEEPEDCPLCGNPVYECVCPYPNGDDCGRFDQSYPGGMMPVGMCRKGGTEECDFECPFRDGSES